MVPSATEIRAYARAYARRSAALLAGGMLVMVGAGFLLAAIWKVLADVYNAPLASLVVAALLIGAGLIVMWRLPPKPVLPDPAQRQRAAGARSPLYTPTGQVPPLTEAFFFGLSVALDMRGRKR